MIEYQGAYFGNLSLAHEKEFPSFSINQEFGAGWSSKKFKEVNLGVSDAGVLVLNYHCVATLEWGDWSVEPQLNLSYLPNEEFGSAVDDRKIAVIWLSISRTLWMNHEH